MKPGIIKFGLIQKTVIFPSAVYYAEYSIYQVLGGGTFDLRVWSFYV